MHHTSWSHPTSCHHNLASGGVLFFEKAVANGAALGA
jgi:hypothetical protein